MLRYYSFFSVGSSAEPMPLVRFLKQFNLENHCGFALYWDAGNFSLLLSCVYFSELFTYQGTKS